MVATVQQTRFGTQFVDLGGGGSSDVTISREWATVRRFRSSPPDTVGDWWIGCTFGLFLPEIGTASIRLRVTNATGGQWVTEPSLLAATNLTGVTKWVKVLDGLEATSEHYIEVQVKVGATTQGFVRLARVEPMWISTPPPSYQQPSIQANVAGGSNQVGGESVQTIANPSVGSETSMIAISVAPGPGYDNPGDTWVEPTANAVSVIDYEVQAGSVHQFVQRVRVWHFIEDGSANYTFGYQKAAGENFQQAALLALDRQVPFVRGFGPVVNTDNNTAYPSVDVVDDYLVIALSTTQQNHELLTQPAGYTPIFNGTTTPGGGSAIQWRRMAQAYKAASNTTETPGGALWSANAGEAHAHFTLAIPPGS